MGERGSEKGAAVVPFDALAEHAKNGDSAWLSDYFARILKNAREGLVSLARIMSDALRKERAAATAKEAAAQRKIIDAAQQAWKEHAEGA